MFRKAQSRSFLFASLVFAFVMMVAGSSLAMADDSVTLEVTSTPEGAEVEVNGRLLGTTHGTFSMEIPAGSELELTVSLEGYEPWERLVDPAVTPVIHVDLEPVDDSAP